MNEMNLYVLILGDSMSHGVDNEQITSHTNMELPTLTVLGNRRIWEPADNWRIREEDRFLLR